MTKTFEITCTASQFARNAIVTLSPISGLSAAIKIVQVNPNPELFEVPDDAFGALLIYMGYNVSHGGKTYELTYSAYTATSVTFSNTSLPYVTTESLEGIERFVNLTSVDLYYYPVRKIDFSKNTKITKLTFWYNPIEELILGNLNITTLPLDYLYSYYDRNVGATSFTASSSKLISRTLNQTSSTGYDKLEYIDISKCLALTSLNCKRNSGKLKFIYVTVAQKAAYDSGLATFFKTK